MVSRRQFDFQVGVERPAEMVPPLSGEVLMENKVAKTYFRRADFGQWVLSEDCPGCRDLRTGQGRQQTHSEVCWRRLEGLLKGDSSGSARLAAADERINRALAEAVERHATKDPGTRGILKRAGVVCHPESEPLRTELATTHTPVSNEESSGSGARPSDTACNDPNTGRGDVTREVRRGPAQDVTRTSSSDDTGDDGVMMEESADEHRAEHPSLLGSDSRRRITTKRDT